MMTEAYLPLAYLNAWEYCPRRFYLEYVLGEMEEFRPLVADNLVLSVLNNRQIQLKDFIESLGAYTLSDVARKSFLQAFDRKMNDEFKHPNFGYRCTYRRAIELQARLLSQHLQEGIPYKSLMLR